MAESAVRKGTMEGNIIAKGVEWTRRIEDKTDKKTKEKAWTGKANHGEHQDSRETDEMEPHRQVRRWDSLNKET